MATYEHTALQQYKDQNGDMHLLYPITKAENVDGLYGDAALTGVPTAPTAATGTNTTQVATTAFVQQELEDVKKSVSDGKTAVANAITAKGVETATDATFAAMAANIGAIESGSGIGLNVFTQETEPETKEGVWVQTANPHQSVVVGNKTYISGEKSGIWIEVSSLPYDITFGSAVVYNNEIHILGGNANKKGHYKWNGTSWVEVSTIPISVYQSSAVVYNNEIHILGGYNNPDSHYKWDGSSWRSVSVIPYTCYFGSAVVYNNEIHILGGMDNGTKHYKFNGSSWVNAGALPYSFSCGSAVVYNNEIHIFGGWYYTGNKYASRTTHYKLNGGSWVKAETLPYAFSFGSAVVYNNEIHILGGDTVALRTNHYKLNGGSWVKAGTLPYSYRCGSSIIYEDHLHILGGASTTNHYSVYDVDAENNSVQIYQNPSNTSGTYATNFISGVPITGENNKFPSGFDDVYYIDDSGNVEESPTYYGDGTQWIKFKN